MFCRADAAANQTPSQQIGTLPAPVATAMMRWSAVEPVPVGHVATGVAPRLQVRHSFRCALPGRVAADDSIALHRARLSFDHAPD